MQVINQHNAHLFHDELDQMFRLRNRVFVEDMGWGDLNPKNGRERDAFDNPLTTYLLGYSEELNEVVGCMRFLPSLAPTLTSEVFPNLCNFKGVPKSAQFYDCSRFVVDPKTALNMGNQSPVASELYCGMVEFGLSLELEVITCVVDLYWFRYMRSREWDVYPLGLPQKAGKESIIAMGLKPTRQMLEMFRSTRGVSGPVLSRSDIGLILSNHRLMHGIGASVPLAA